MIHFLLNENEIHANEPAGMTVLDFIRYKKHLTGTKIGCREGDCGACTILVGNIENDALVYRSMTSCLMPLGNAHGKHIVTIEGINLPGELNLVQSAMAKEGATQCGFCTPGFVMSLAGFCLDNSDCTAVNAIAAVDGNICRCTGYKSIERAAKHIAQSLQERKDKEPAVFASANNILPPYFSTLKLKLKELQSATNGMKDLGSGGETIIGGGTDLYVQKLEIMERSAVQLFLQRPELRQIQILSDRCVIGGAATVSDMMRSSVIQKYFPRIAEYAWLISSTPIRNMATIAGNIVNASPIGDLSIFLLALDANLTLTDGINKRELPLRDFFKGYKQLNKSDKEYIESISFAVPHSKSLFHFEKVSKRTNLDIASVNTAIFLSVKDQLISEAGLSAGGVAPIPLYLRSASTFLKGKMINENTVQELLTMLNKEISPISDARGTASYKKLLLRQLVAAHFITMYPKLNPKKILLSAEY